jgi:hypothetical protein
VEFKVNFRDFKVNLRSRVAETCQQCQLLYFPKSADRKTYCSRECAFTAKASRPWCAVYFCVCKGCSKAFTARRNGKLFCSVDCNYEIHLAEIKTRRPYRHLICHHCNSSFSTRKQGQTRFCSVECRRTAFRQSETGRDIRNEQKRLRKARQSAAYVQHVHRQRIYERDGWKCGVCHCKVNPSLKAPHPKSKTIDHIVPLSKGGTHEPRNVQLAHYGCNSRRGTKGPAQLRLTP